MGNGVRLDQTCMHDVWVCGGGVLAYCWWPGAEASVAHAGERVSSAKPWNQHNEQATTLAEDNRNRQHSRSGSNGSVCDGRCPWHGVVVENTIGWWLTRRMRVNTLHPGRTPSQAETYCGQLCEFSDHLLYNRTLAVQWTQTV